MTFFRNLALSFVIIIIFSGYAVAKERVPVFVSIAPQKHFVQQIGKSLVDVQVMVPSGGDPHSYEPKPRQMAALSKARLYFAIGVPFENVWLAKIAAVNPKMKMVHTDHGIDKIPMEAHHHHEDNHAHHDDEETHHDDDQAHHENEHAHRKAEGAHHQDDQDHHEDEHAHRDEDHESHAGDEHSAGKELDPHIWLAPSLVKIQARTIRDALQASDPAHKADYAANYKKFAADIDRLDADLRKVFAGKQGLRFMVFHPSWGYFAKAYKLKQVPIEIEGKDPKPAQLKELIEDARENRVRVVFVQPQFSARSAKLVAREIGGQVVFVDPLAEDWMDNLRKVADKFKMALR